MSNAVVEVICEFNFEDVIQSRKKLFDKAIFCTKTGKVLYILPEELNELPELSQDLIQIDRHYMKMITFLYVPDIKSLIESLIILPNWQNVPSTIILDNLGGYGCGKDNVQNAFGIIAFLIDTVKSCSKVLKTTCKLYLSAEKEVFGEENCNLMNELYCLHTMNKIYC